MSRISALLVFLWLPGGGAGGEPVPSHRPMRTLPTASVRPLPAGPVYYVDGSKGQDQAPGTREAPWQTLAHACAKLKPGDTLLLRGGVYHEHIEISPQGTAEKPITIRSHPGEVAILDGGFREFLTDPAAAWEPAPRGIGEYRSRKQYPPGQEGARRDVHVCGNFADSLVPLHGYRFESDFRTDEIYWKLTNNQDAVKGLYCGPGLWFDPADQRIHVRLSHTKYQFLGKENYRGATDPRKLPLVVAGARTVFHLTNARHVILQGLVVRGSASATVRISASEHITLEGVTIFGGAPALVVEATNHLTLAGCVLRGVSAPWSSRASNKYRGLSSYLFIAAGSKQQSRHWTIRHCEFTDNHDGLILGTVNDLQFHHNLVDNFDDDGIYLTLSRPHVPAKIHIYQNLLGRSLSLFAFAESGRGVKNAIGPGVHIYRNIIDLRRGTFGIPPASIKDDEATSDFPKWMRPSRLVGDHGSPVWEPMIFYHNTVLWHEPAFRQYYGMGLAGHAQGSKRRVFNNIFVQYQGQPGLAFGSIDEDVEADRNLLWSIDEGPKSQGDFFASFRKTKLFTDSKNRHAPGWGATDIYADPRFATLWPRDVLAADWQLSKQSPAIDRGIELPRYYPDSLRKLDHGAPDLGAVPLGAPALRVGPAALKQ